MVRVIDRDGEIVNLLIGLTAVKWSLPAPMLKGIIRMQQESVGSTYQFQICAMGDSVATNLAVMKTTNAELNGLSSSDRFQRCFSHMITNNGNELTKVTPKAKAFLSGMKGLSVSDSAKEVWSDICNCVFPEGSTIFNEIGTLTTL
jgi:hypothetical protein